MGVALSHDLLRVSLCCSGYYVVRQTLVCYNIKVSLLLYSRDAKTRHLDTVRITHTSTLAPRNLLTHSWSMGHTRAKYRKSTKDEEAFTDLHLGMVPPENPSFCANFHMGRSQTSIWMHICVAYSMEMMQPRIRIRNFGMFSEISHFLADMYCLASM